jgi:hypothetical protein
VPSSEFCQCNVPVTQSFLNPSCIPISPYRHYLGAIALSMLGIIRMLMNVASIKT